MAPERYQEIKRVFQAAEELPFAERDAYIRDACNGDTDLLEAVAGLIAEAGDSGEFFSGGVAALAPRLAKRSIIGQTIGHYKIIRELGSGGMGRVYLASRSDDFKKSVAIKLLRPDVDSEALIARFRIERQILAAFDHPNIAKLLDGGTTDNELPYLVMEYIEGVPIDTYCDQHKLSIADRLRLFLPVCDAVQYAHRNLVVHRDLKPGNILVTQDATPKLLDFGIAKLLRPELSPVTQAFTVAGTRAMTPEYASPEQVLGAPITTASDVYSLGAVLYELLTGHKPYRLKTKSEHEVYEMAREGEPTRPSTVVRSSHDGSTPETVSAARNTQPEKLRRTLTGDLDNILLRSLQKSPLQRYSSVEQFAEDIRRYLEGRPVLAHKESFYYRANKFVLRNKGRVTAAALLTLTLLGGIMATGWEAHVARAERARADRRFHDVRKLAHSVVFELHDAIQNLPGATAARELLVKRALEYLDNLAAEASGDTALQIELAAAYQKIGAVQWTVGGASHLGHHDEAMASQQKALAIRKAILASDPGNVTAKTGLAVSYLLVGDLKSGGATDRERLSDYRQAVRVSEELVAAHPKDRSMRMNLANAYQKIGDMLVGNVWFRHRTDIVGKWDAPRPDADIPGALATFQRAQELREQLADEQPQDLTARASLGIGYEKLAMVREAQSDFPAALSLLQKSLAISREVYERRPNDVRALANLIVANDLVGNALVVLGKPAAALDSYAKALALREPLAAADPHNAGAHEGLLWSYMGMSYASTKAGRNADARLYGLRLIAATKSWAERPNASADDWEDYAWTLLTCDPPSLRQPAQGLAAAKRALEMSRSRDPDILDTLALASFRMGDRAQAITTEQEALAHATNPLQRKEFEANLHRFETGRD